MRRKTSTRQDSNVKPTITITLHSLSDQISSLKDDIYRKIDQQKDDLLNKLQLENLNLIMREALQENNDLVVTIEKDVIDI